MNVLVACEESQRVCTAFRERGHNAFSCDIHPCSGGHPEWHIQGDALAILTGCEIIAMDGIVHNVEHWDMLIAHPPCTYLSNAGAVRLYPQKGILNQERYEKGLEAKRVFMAFLTADIEHICVENPIPTRIYGLPAYTQIVQPYEHGHPYSKKTCLWLKNLPLLEPTDVITENIISWVNKKRDAKTRSKTFPGIARAMAEQWG